MNAPAKPLNIRLPNMLGKFRREELRMLRRLRVEAAMPEWYPER